MTTIEYGGTTHIIRQTATQGSLVTNVNIDWNELLLNNLFNAVLLYKAQQSNSIELLIMAARQLAGRRPLYFTADVSSYFFSSPNLGGFWADRHQTLPHVRWW